MVWLLHRLYNIFVSVGNMFELTRKHIGPHFKGLYKIRRIAISSHENIHINKNSVMPTSLEQCQLAQFVIGHHVVLSCDKNL